jgi:hypothetical protein
VGFVRDPFEQNEFEAFDPFLSTKQYRQIMQIIGTGAKSITVVGLTLGCSSQLRFFFFFTENRAFTSIFLQQSPIVLRACPFYKGRLSFE